MSFLPFEKSSTPVPFVRAPQRRLTGPDDIQDDNEFKKHVLNNLEDIKDYLYNGFKIYDLDRTQAFGSVESMPRQPSTARPQQGGRKKTRSQKKTRRHQKTRRHR